MIPIFAVRIGAANAVAPIFFLISPFQRQALSSVRWPGWPVPWSALSYTNHIG
jgi:hypothetical protein